MDKVRALQYFLAAAHERSFSGAARQLDVTVPAIARLVTVLERSLGVSLFDRTVQGLTLTAAGASYLEACQPLVAQLAALDESVRSAAARPRGTLVLGAPAFVSQHCILPALPHFHSRHPDIVVDVRTVDRLTVPEASAAEVLILLGWPDHADMVHRRIAQTRLVICASPAYWAANGVPQRPKDLENHVCLLFRDHEGTVLDLWEYERDTHKESAAVSGWLVSSHRDVLLDAALAGAGVARLTDLTVRAHLRSGRLVPVLVDWETKHSPPVNLFYRGSQRRTPRVRLFVDFVTQLFRDIENECDYRPAEPVSVERPHWYRRRHGRSSGASRDRHG